MADIVDSWMNLEDLKLDHLNYSFQLIQLHGKLHCDGSIRVDPSDPIPKTMKKSMVTDIILNIDSMSNGCH